MKADKIIETRIRKRDAADERQYMINENYEVYVKQGEPTGAMSFHYHNFYEIVYVMEGDYFSMIENQMYHLKKGDFLLVDLNVMHKYHYVEKKQDSSKRIILWITPQMLERISEGNMELSECFRGRDSHAYHFPVYYEEMLRGYLLKLAMDGTEEEEAKGAKLLLDKGYLSLFFTYLNILCERREYVFNNEEIVSHPLVEKVSYYIDAHLSERITVEQLAGYVHMSKYHFLRKFKELTGVTVHSFIIDKRLIKSCEELRKGAGITQAYQAAGFTDYSSFLRNFRAAYGVAPGKYMEFYL